MVGLTIDHAEANAPPMLNYGWVYPQALLIFTITLVYSVVSPLILVFGAIYFGVSCELRNYVYRCADSRSGVQIQAPVQYVEVTPIDLIKADMQSTSSHTSLMGKHGESRSTDCSGL